MMQKSDFNDLLFPKRLVLRFDSKGRRKHWHAYRSAVETFIRLRGLESHLQREYGPPSVELDEKERRRWEAEDKLCISIITLNTKGELPVWLGRMYEEGRPAAALWKELWSIGTGGSHPFRVGQSKPMSREDDLFVKVLIGVSFAAFITMGFIIVIKAPPSAFETQRRF
ncbi:hypothetical protein VTO73DRAFT_8539 [Trametes versicolor]